MSNAARLGTIIAIVSLALSATPAAADLELDVDPLSHEVSVASATAEQQALVEWAMGRYEAAALPLPSLTIMFQDDLAGCDGNLGYYDAATNQLDMCNWGQHYKITPASTLLHELGHAWSFEHMDAAAQAAFVAYRGLDTWDDHRIWWRMGQEQAAEIIAWGIGGDGFFSVYLDEIPEADLAAAYDLLTRQPTPLG